MEGACPAVLKFPAVSANAPTADVMEMALVPLAVKVAVYRLKSEVLTLKSDKAPPVTVKLEALRATVGISEALNVIVVVPPLANEDAPEVIVMVGAAVSRVKVRLAVAELPAVSVSVTTTVCSALVVGAV